MIFYDRKVFWWVIGILGAAVITGILVSEHNIS